VKLILRRVRYLVTVTSSELIPMVVVTALVIVVITFVVFIMTQVFNKQGITLD
jgi:hypothetical protein